MWRASSLSRLVASLWISLVLVVACQPESVPSPSRIATPAVDVQQASPSVPSPTFSATTTAVPASTRGPTHTPMDEADESATAPTLGGNLMVTIVYDNNAYDGRLRTAWGFAAMVEYRDEDLLFDTGGEGEILLDNMAILGIDPSSIDSVVLSHIHGDHTGGLTALMENGTRPTVYLPPSFPANFKRQVSGRTDMVEVMAGQAIAEGIFTTGEMGRSIPEQALVIEMARGLVVITGCAHPGIVQVATQAKESFGGQIHLVMGGFHLGGKIEAEISAILAAFRKLGVEKVAPCHCTGDRAIAMFAAEYGDDFIEAGVGRMISIP